MLHQAGIRVAANVTERTPVVLVDDHPVVRDGLSYLLAEQPDFVVVGEAEDSDAALDVVARTAPQVVVLDLSLQGREAIPLLAELRQRWPQLRVLVLSMHDEDLYAERLIELGAHGYVMKQEEPAEFLRALRRVVAGDIHLSRSLSSRAKIRLRHRAQKTGGTSVAALTRRERDVLGLVARGMDVHEISAELGMSPKTVDSHRRNIREKLGLANARDVVRYAVRWAGDEDDPGRPE
jgi:DNA-binding NarL/FixJ family response regulator